jgi:hypothetical protein
MNDNNYSIDIHQSFLVYNNPMIIIHIMTNMMIMMISIILLFFNNMILLSLLLLSSLLPLPLPLLLLCRNTLKYKCVIIIIIIMIIKIYFVCIQFNVIIFYTWLKRSEEKRRGEFIPAWNKSWNQSSLFRFEETVTPRTNSRKSSETLTRWE